MPNSAERRSYISLQISLSIRHIETCSKTILNSFLLKLVFEMFRQFSNHLGKRTLSTTFSLRETL